MWRTFLSWRYRCTSPSFKNVSFLLFLGSDESGQEAIAEAFVGSHQHNQISRAKNGGKKKKKKKTEQNEKRRFLNVLEKVYSQWTKRTDELLETKEELEERQTLDHQRLQALREQQKQQGLFLINLKFWFNQFSSRASGSCPDWGVLSASEASEWAESQTGSLEGAHFSSQTRQWRDPGRNWVAQASNFKLRKVLVMKVLMSFLCPSSCQPFLLLQRHCPASQQHCREPSCRGGFYSRKWSGHYSRAKRFGQNWGRVRGTRAQGRRKSHRSSFFFFFFFFFFFLNKFLCSRFGSWASFSEMQR